MMGSKTRIDDHFMHSVEQKEQDVKMHTDHSDNVDDDNSNFVPSPSLSSLVNTDPSVLSTIFQSSKIKSFMYKIEPNIAKFNGPSLDLISTTAAIFLKTLVEKAVKREQDDASNQRHSKIRKEGDQLNCCRDSEKQVGSLDAFDHFLITSNHLKGIVSANIPSSLVFLEETYKNFIDKDSSVLPSKLHEYIPRKISTKNRRGTKRSSAKLCNTQTNTCVQLESYEEGDKKDDGISGKRLKRNFSRKDDSSCLLLVPKTNPLDKAIENAAFAEDTLSFGKIIEDDDDYD